MPVFAALLLLSSPQPSIPMQALTAIKAALGTGNKQRVDRLFAQPANAAYLFSMASRTGGLHRLKVKVIPVPPGWEGEGVAWAVVHTFQEIEQDHDTVFPVIRTAEGWRLGKEIPEWFPSSHKIDHAKLDVVLRPAQNQALINANLSLSQKNPGAAPVFRLNDVYGINHIDLAGKRQNTVTATDESIPQVKEGDFVRAGGLLIYWSKKPLKNLVVDYSGTVNVQGHDKIRPNVAHLTANWVPNLGRLPFTTATRIRGPKEWPVVLSEGNAVSQQAAGFEPVTASGSEQVVAFKCDIPLSYPKVNGGMYKLAAQGTDKGRTFRAWHFEVDKDRGEHDVQRMIDFCRFFDDKLGPFPFKSYDVLDGDGYYGIESYSYTVLAPNITRWATSHEMGHTYFGGVVPSAYTRDTWNEGVTQYVDSVLFLKNADGTLQRGLATVELNLPLSKMDIAWDNGNATYMRGAYVMNMLAAEIGEAKMYEGLRALIKDRIGKETVWSDLRQYFEKASGKKLDWFWSQWIDNGSFPTLTVRQATLARKGGTFSTNVAVRQSGTPAPFRMRYIVRLRRGSQKVDKVVTMSSPEIGVTIESNFAPTEATLEAFPHTLAKVGRPAPVRG